jgi:hypothetical protein
MAANAIEIPGTLHADGTLVLDEKPDLPPGRVKVTVQPANPLGGAGNDVISILNRIHTAQAQRGHVPRSVEEIEASLADLRDDERTEMIERIQEECRRQREGGRPAEAE